MCSWRTTDTSVNMCLKSVSNALNIELLIVECVTELLRVESGTYNWYDIFRQAGYDEIVDELSSVWVLLRIYILRAPMGEKRSIELVKRWSGNGFTFFWCHLKRSYIKNMFCMTLIHYLLSVVCFYCFCNDIIVLFIRINCDYINTWQL